MKKNAFIKNIVTGFGGQFIAIILGIIIPKIFISSYGSDANGLLGTISQIFTYMALLEAGIGQAAKNALFKPFHENNKDDIITIASTAKKYYKKFTIIYGICVFALAFILPLLLNTNVDTKTVFLIIIFEGMGGVISFYYITTSTVILAVDGRNYVNNGINLLNKIIGYIVKIVMATFGFSIALLQFVYFLITVVKVFFYNNYFKKHYPWIKYKRVPSTMKLADRNSYVITEIATTVFNSTAMIVLSMFLSTQIASVYSIYNMIYSNIHFLVNSVYFSIVYILGHAYHANLKKYEIVHDIFTSMFLGVMTSLMSVCYVLAIPFVTLYTNGVNDVNYIQPTLPVLFSLVQILSWSRYVNGNLTCVAGYAKQTSYVSLIEAIMNIVLSVILVKKMGIVGVLLAAVISLPIKVIWCIYIADKKIMKRPYLKTISILGVNYLFFACVVLLSQLFKPSVSSYLEFFVWGVCLLVFFLIVVMGINFLVNRDCWDMTKKYILSKQMVKF